MPTMGLGKLGSDQVVFKRKNRWMFRIGDIVGDPDQGLRALPPMKGARPNLKWKEFNIEHINETIYFPGKPDWQPFTLTVYDVCSNEDPHPNGHPVFAWIREIYDPSNETYNPIIRGTNASFKKNAFLELLTACGTVMERWVFENAWPQTANFGELEMSSSEVVLCEMTLRYDRAYPYCCRNQGGECVPGPCAPV
jgi:hypothetical protein